MKKLLIVLIVLSSCSPKIHQSTVKEEKAKQEEKADAWKKIKIAVGLIVFIYFCSKNIPEQI
jgi:hypothetical protein